VAKFAAEFFILSLPKDIDMSILRCFKFIQVFFVFSTVTLSLCALPLDGYCNDNWVRAANNDNNVIYYNPASVKINKQKKIINVSTKWVFTDRGKIDFSKNVKDNDNHKLKDIDYSIILYSFNYKEWKCNISNITEYTKSGKKIYNDESAHKWRDIPHNGVIDTLLNKILQKYNIKR
jgi:hypothetical protein